MPNHKPITSRIGTCRSGTSFDVPHEFENENVDTLLEPFSIDELIDIFSMTEASFSRSRDSLEKRHELKTLYRINEHIRGEMIMAKIADVLESMGLVTSPNLVQHGLTLLLG